MPGAPFRRTPKIGRNELCPCGSGRKFKRCHGGPEYALPTLVRQAKFEKAIFEEGRRLIERHKAKELQRQKQQGLGRPIISIEHKGFRFVAVGNRLYYGKWKTFFDSIDICGKHYASSLKARGYWDVLGFTCRFA